VRTRTSQRDVGRGTILHRAGLAGDTDHAVPGLTPAAHLAGRGPSLGGPRSIVCAITPTGTANATLSGVAQTESARRAPEPTINVELGRPAAVRRLGRFERVATAPISAARALGLRWALVGGGVGAALGGFVGLVVGLLAHPPTAWFAVFELGVPAATLGAVVGLASGAVGSVRRRPPRDSCR
jgi:hypothetical protein